MMYFLGMLIGIKSKNKYGSVFEFYISEFYNDYTAGFLFKNPWNK